MPCHQWQINARYSLGKDIIHESNPRWNFMMVLFLMSTFVLMPTSGSAASQQASNQGRAIAKKQIGKPVAAGQFLFWRDVRNKQELIYGYDLSRQQEFVVTNKADDKRSLASDGQTLVWVERQGAKSERIQGFNAYTRKEFTIVDAKGATSFGGLAIADGVLYYQDVTPDRQGLYARTLATGQEQLISTTGRDPVAADGTLLWSEEINPQQDTSEWILHLRKTSAGISDRILARRAGQFTSYNVSGDHVVWSAFLPAADPRVYLHTISSNTSEAISTGGAFYPVVKGTKVAWTNAPNDEAGQPILWSVQEFDVSTRTIETIVEPSTTAIATWGIADQDTLALSIGMDSSQAPQELYVSSLKQRGLRFTAKSAMLTTMSVCGQPICGQVYKSGVELRDSDGRYKVNGVQFFLPERAINGSTFDDGNYNGALGSIDYWLGISKDYLLVKTLRIFVNLPGTSSFTTSQATVYDFAMRAKSRGQRLGIVLQNSSDFDMSQAERDWLNGLITYFSDRGAKDTIAYVSAGNEINNGCGGADCFDGDQGYVDRANNWVYEFVNIFRSRNSGILTTVGISTEVGNRNGDTRPAWYDFFKPASSGRTMASTVDFISPHNYAGGSYGIWNDLRYVYGYQGPIVLEEYGFSTDPKSKNPRFTEGPTSCRTDPLNSVCNNTAPYFVEINAKSIRELNYAGGVAWMLADINSKRCGLDPADLWTGLFTSAGEYCGGTYTAPGGRDKATAFRVRTHHYYY